ncbi:hypothetical protein M5K25_020732 [Dendrobium thyrsiflorum]|uniref:Uncharacterized protein n=1 Tax=Dendrobium thyrsiflorum TaxID=117978 RepID=A0ABD0UHJ6_DENTH
MASPVVKLSQMVLARAYPLAKRKSPLPPTMGISLTGWSGGLRPSTERTLPLYLPAVKARFMAMRKPNSSWAAPAYMPWARPTDCDFGSGPSVRRSSIMVITPKYEKGWPTAAGLVTGTAVALRPPTTSWK